MTQSIEDFEFIYLQSRENSEAEGRLWCQDSIYEDDTKYIRYDLHEKVIRDMQGRIKELEEDRDSCKTVGLNLIEEMHKLDDKITELEKENARLRDLVGSQGGELHLPRPSKDKEIRELKRLLESIFDYTKGSPIGSNLYNIHMQIHDYFIYRTSPTA